MEIKQNDLTNGFKISLQDVYNIYEKWLHVSDRDRIDVVLATALTINFKGSPIWLIIVSPSGDWKSEQIRALEKEGKTVVLERITAKTLVSGIPKMGANIDLAPQLNNKLVLFPDFASMLKLMPDEKGQIFAQLRELYDGKAGGCFGTGKNATYKGIRVTMIIGSTPAIDRQILVHQDLGTRELVYRPIIKSDEFKKIQEKIIFNRINENDMRTELNNITNAFLDNIQLKEFELSEKVKEELSNLTEYLRVMRASAAMDASTGELLGDVDVEMPTRVLKQFITLFNALKSLDEDYTDEHALRILKTIAISSGNRNRMKIFNHLSTLDGQKLVTYQIADYLKIGRKSCFSDLCALWNLGVVRRYSGESIGKPWLEAFYWRLNNTKERTKQLKAFDESISWADIDDHFLINKEDEEERTSPTQTNEEEEYHKTLRIG